MSCHQKNLGEQGVVDQQPCSSKLRGSKHSEVNNEDVCRCMKMGEDEDDNGNKWIVCDICSKKYDITILILKMICFFVKNVNESLADRCIHVL